MSGNVRWSASNLTTPGGQQATAIPAALALTGLVTIGVAFFAGGPPGDASQTVLLEIGGALVVLFGVITVVVARRTAAHVSLAWDGQALRLDVQPPGRPAVSYVGPFHEQHGFVRSAVHTGRGSIPQLTLEVAILDANGRCVLLLRELLGAVYDPPPGWQDRPLAVRTEHVFTNSLGRTNLDRLVAALGKG